MDFLQLRKCPLYWGFIVYRNEDPCFLRAGQRPWLVTAFISSGSWEEEGHLLLLDELWTCSGDLAWMDLIPRETISKSCQQVHSFSQYLCCFMYLHFRYKLRSLWWLARFWSIFSILLFILFFLLCFIIGNWDPHWLGYILEVTTLWLSNRMDGEGNGTPLQHSCLEKSHGRRSLVGHSPWGR